MNVQKNKPIAIWLCIGAIMIIIQVLLGGITRLTGSGLSITEWKPILGALPPMNEQEWNIAFEKYKEIAQYKYIHNYFNLHDFKFIYFWEWFHRNWGRFMGIVFIVPFIYFLYTKKFDKSMIVPMIILFVLGGLQGAIGWIMVSSGVGTDLLYVSHIRLAIHFIAALVLLAYIIWFALRIAVPDDQIMYAPRIRQWNILLLVLLTIQLIYGAFMAGTHAAESAITWPSINGTYYPGRLLFTEGNFLNDITHNLITIQFMHRNLAYILVILIIIFTMQLYKQPKSSGLWRMRYWPLLLLILQIILGILALVNYLNTNKLLFSLLHQLVGILLFISLLLTYYFSRKKPA